MIQSQCVLNDVERMTIQSTLTPADLSLTSAPSSSSIPFLSSSSVINTFARNRKICSEWLRPQSFRCYETPLKGTHNDNQD